MALPSVSVRSGRCWTGHLLGFRSTEHIQLQLFFCEDNCRPSSWGRQTQVWSQPFVQKHTQTHGGLIKVDDVISREALGSLLGMKSINSHVAVLDLTAESVCMCAVMCHCWRNVWGLLFCRSVFWQSLPADALMPVSSSQQSWQAASFQVPPSETAPLPLPVLTSLTSCAFSAFLLELPLLCLSPLILSHNITRDSKNIFREKNLTVFVNWRAESWGGGFFVVFTAYNLKSHSIYYYISHITQLKRETNFIST